jgi:hypothetical protein
MGPRALLALLLLGTVLLTACGRQEVERPLPPMPFQPGAPGARAYLLVSQVDERTLSFLSPTFRCAPDYCAGYVIMALQELAKALGPDALRWATEAVPDQEFIELRVTYNPSRLDGRRVVEAVREAMDRYRDPRFPAGVEVAYVPERPEALPVLVSSERTVGRNRLQVALLDRQNEPVLDADVALRFYRLAADGNEVPVAEAKAQRVTVTRSYVHRHPDGTVERHQAGTVGAYVAYVDFPQPGTYQVEVLALRRGRALPPVRLEFQVTEEGVGPKVGQPAPPSRQPVLRDVQDIDDIDSSLPKRPHMHTLRIADALGQGKPVVIAFATPAFCVSRLCGPVMDEVMDPLYDKYRQQAIFVHVEPYDLRAAREGKGLSLSQTMREWDLPSEPWIFVLDSQGRVAAKFEGIVSREEVEQALLGLLTD